MWDIYLHHDRPYFVTLLFHFRLQQETRDFMAMLRHYKLPLDDAFTNAPVLTLEQVSHIVVCCYSAYFDLLVSCCFPLF